MEVGAVFTFFTFPLDPKFAVLAASGDVFACVVFFFLVYRVLFGCLLCLVQCCIIDGGLDSVGCDEPGGFNFVFCDKSWDIVIVMFPVL